MAKIKQPARKKPAQKAPGKPQAAKQPCITLAQLKQARACTKACQEFQQLFGKSAPLTPATIKKVILSEHLGLWWLRAQLESAGCNAAARFYSRIETLASRAEARVWRTLPPAEERSCEARRLSREIGQLQKHTRRVLEHRQRPVQELYEQIAAIEEGSCKLREDSDAAVAQLQEQLSDAADKAGFRLSNQAQLEAVRPHLTRLANLAAAYLPGQDLTPGVL